MKTSKEYCDRLRTMNKLATSFTESSVESCKMCFDCMFSATEQFCDLEESSGFLYILNNKMHFLLALMHFHIRLLCAFTVPSSQSSIEENLCVQLL